MNLMKTRFLLVASVITARCFQSEAHEAVDASPGHPWHWGDCCPLTRPRPTWCRFMADFSCYEMEVLAACCALSNMAAQGDVSKVKEALREVESSVEALVTFIYR